MELFEKQRLEIIAAVTKPNIVGFSSVSQGRMYDILNCMRLTKIEMSVGELKGYAGPISIPPFCEWDCFKTVTPATATKPEKVTYDENAAIAPILAHLREFFSLPPGTHFEDVHDNHTLFRFSITDQSTGQITVFTGSTDIIVTASMTQGISNLRRML